MNPRRSKAKKEGISPPEGDRSKLRKDKGPKRDLGTHVFEVGSSRHPEPMYSAPSTSSHPPEQNLVWLEDARSRGRAPVMKAGGSHSPRITDNPPDRSPRSWSGSDAEMESESESRPPQYQLHDDARYSRAYSRESQPYPPREVHPSYAHVQQEAPPMRRQTSSSSVPRRRNSDDSRASEEDPNPDPDRPAKRSRRENEHAPDESDPDA